MNVCVVGGAGYVGLVTSVGLAAIGHRVTAVDVNEEAVARLRAGDSPIYEEGLADLLHQGIESGRLQFTNTVADGLNPAEVVFVAVGTPSRSDGQADLSQVIRVTEDLAAHLHGYKVVVVKSTVPVGSVELVRSVLGRQKREGVDFDLVANPEFLREGKGLIDFFHPDRIVLGASSERAMAVMRALYEPFFEAGAAGDAPLNGSGQVPLVETDIASAQMIKYASNSFLAMRISFVNEIAALCERVGADVREVARGLSYDPRIGRGYMEAGLGFGGPCLEKDLRALIRIGEETRYEPRLLRAILERNDQQLREIVAKIKATIGYLLYRRLVAVFGLAFKGGTNDVRNSLGLRLILELEREGALVRGYDPLATANARLEQPGGTYLDDPYEAVAGAEALIIASDWPEFKELDLGRVRTQMARPCIIDGRNLLEPAGVRAMGFQYVGVGIR